MTEMPCLTPAGRGRQTAREERLARALRDNLRRRKEQLRARAPQRPGRGDDRPSETGPGDEPTA